MRSLENTEDTLDIRDLIERIEEVEGDEEADEDDRAEAASMRSFVEEFRSYGGDEEWEGDWFPVTFIRDSYFRDYAEEMAQDIGAISREYQWPQSHIDWEAAANALQIDYTSGEYDGVTYWAR